MIDPRCISQLNKALERQGPVIYWMSRDQRVQQNRALHFARMKADALRQPLLVVFTLVPSFIGATLRQYHFMLKGLQEVERSLRELNIGFVLLQCGSQGGGPGAEIGRFARSVGAGCLITDYSPLNISRRWKDDASAQLGVPMYEVDAHNIVPCLAASGKQEYAARTFRPKINRLLGEFLMPLPPVEAMAVTTPLQAVDWESALGSLSVDTTVPPVTWLAAGESAAREHLRRFIAGKLPRYHEERNDPNAEATSTISAYLHFGQLSAAETALEVMAGNAPEEAKAAFLEELIIRRELSDNYCAYNQHYDAYEGLPGWARASLKHHEGDLRDALYTPDQFDRAETHDRLWNAAQNELLRTGKIHGYMRMYWAKKILEWSPSPQQAFETAVWLNDRYALDGRDPNGYSGIAWSIGGLHDRPWFERPVYGKIRYMNASGCRRKFDVERYIMRQNAG
ncbi:MAG: deoxyribodipyrimidine photo-lyase [Chlorobium sp.]|nr:deoxyribodipyrimidine photo-lyase [Chlorobium phaeovibrioides]NQU46512.1 deoxyribodipyrimidine photo-lyase [Chlorobium sp.]